MAQTSLAEFYVRRSSVTSSAAPDDKDAFAEPLSAKDEMMAAYGAWLGFDLLELMSVHVLQQPAFIRHHFAPLDAVNIL
jgi:hypothetical protein